MIDLHCHTKFGRHAKGDIIDYIDSASQNKINVLGFSEHLFLPKGFYDPAGDSAMLPKSLPKYLNDIKEAKRKVNSQVSILTAFEVDFIPEFRNEFVKNLAGLKVDYLIGSVHFINGWNFDFSEETFKQGLEERYNGDARRAVYDYLNLVKEVVVSGLFDVVGHLDLIKKFNFNRSYFDDSESYYKNTIKEILDEIKAKDLVVEINTAGLDKKVKEQYPSEWIIRECCKRDIPITMGSDAHKPAEVGRHFAEMTRMLKRVGYKRTTCFQGRKRLTRPL